MKYFLLFSMLLGSCATLNVHPDEYPSQPRFHHEPHGREVTSVRKKKKRTMVAVVDTGFDFKSTWSNNKEGIAVPKICETGSESFTGTGLEDNHGHGTHIAGLIAREAKDADYCIVVLKYFDPKVTNNDNLISTRHAFQKALALHVDIINYSGGGTEKSEEECALMKKALDSGILVVAAAGNERSNINDHPYYPASCDPRIITVENIEANGMPSPSTNYTDGRRFSKKLEKEVGTFVLSTLPGNSVGYMTGTSQAAAVRTGKIVRSLSGQ